MEIVTSWMERGIERGEQKLIKRVCQVNCVKAQSEWETSLKLNS